MSSEYDPAGERPGRRMMTNIDQPESVTTHHLRNAIISTCVALQFAPDRAQAMACWGALRSLLEAKFGLERGG